MRKKGRCDEKRHRDGGRTPERTHVPGSLEAPHDVIGGLVTGQEAVARHTADEALSYHVGDGQDGEDTQCVCVAVVGHQQRQGEVRKAGRALVEHCQAEDTGGGRRPPGRHVPFGIRLIVHRPAPFADRPFRSGAAQIRFSPVIA